MDPESIPKYAAPLVIPPAMPPAPNANITPGRTDVTEYEIGVREFDQQILPSGCGMTTVWGYGKVGEPSTYNYPGFTVEGRSDQTIRVRWVNELVDDKRNHLDHLLPVDQTIHKATPDFRNPSVIVGDGGPVPMVTHVHGAHVESESDGGPEQWWLPNAKKISPLYANRGPRYATQFPVPPGQAVYEYDQSQRAATLWYHDHALGLTRLNVYAGMAGFWLIRDAQEDNLALPGPPPGVGDDPFGTYYEIPLAIQDRTFKADGDLFYPPDRQFFDGFDGPFATGSEGEEPLPPPVWNPEFFGETMVVNGRTWPKLEVDAQRYRFRILNGCNSRFVILRLETDNGPPPTIWQIGNEGGFLDTGDNLPIQVPYLLLAPAERADVIIDFAGYEGSSIHLVNLGPDAPFGGLPADFDPDDRNYWGGDSPTDETRAVMRFDVKDEVVTDDPSADPALDELILPDALALGATDNTRWLTLNELIYEPADAPIAALLGTYDGGQKFWEDEVTEIIGFNDVEEWNLMNFTEDSHPIHLHLVHFKVVGRYELDENCFPDSESRPADPAECKGEPVPMSIYPWEAGYKDTIIANPGEITVVKAQFDKYGWYVWHCHIVEHEDNEMMRPMIVE